MYCGDNKRENKQLTASAVLIYIDYKSIYQLFGISPVSVHRFNVMDNVQLISKII